MFLLTPELQWGGGGKGGGFATKIYLYGVSNTPNPLFPITLSVHFTAGVFFGWNNKKGVHIGVGGNKPPKFYARTIQAQWTKKKS